MNDDWDPEDLESDFAVGTAFRVHERTRKDYVEVVSVSHIRPSSASSDGYGVFGEPYWSHRVRCQPSEDISASERDQTTIAELSGDEIREKFDSGAWSRLTDQAGLDEF